MQLRDTNCVLLNRRLPLQTIMPKVPIADDKVCCRQQADMDGYTVFLNTLGWLAVVDFACCLAGSAFDGFLRGMLFLVATLVVAPLKFDQYMERKEGRQVE